MVDTCFWTEEVRATETCEEGGGEEGMVLDAGPNAYPVGISGLQCRLQFGYSPFSPTDDVQITRARLFYWPEGAPPTGNDIATYVASATSVEELLFYEDDSSPVIYPGLFLYDEGNSDWRFPNPSVEGHEYLQTLSLSFDFYQFMLIYEVTVNGEPYGAYIGGYIEAPV